MINVRVTVDTKTKMSGHSKILFKSSSRYRNDFRMHTRLETNVQLRQNLQGKGKQSL